jgi:hypothetical protein
MYVRVHFGVEHSNNLNRPGTGGGYFIKLTTRRQSVNNHHNHIKINIFYLKFHLCE